MRCWHTLKRNSGNRVLSILLIYDLCLGLCVSSCVRCLVNKEMFRVFHGPWFHSFPNANPKAVIHAL